MTRGIFRARGTCRASRIVRGVALAAGVASLASFASFALGVAFERDARAQFTFQMGAMGGRDVQASLDANDCEVGDTVHVTLQAMSESTMPDNPTLGAHPGFTVVGGPVVSTSRIVSSVNGRTSNKRGITATWLLRAEKTGTFTFTAPSANAGGTRLVSNALKIRVVQKGTLQRGGGNPLDPFGQQSGPSTLDPWKGFFDDDLFKRPETPTLDPTLALDHDDSAPVFLHAFVDKTNAVVGEQVTYVVYLYSEYSLNDFDFTPEHEMSAPSFVRRMLAPEDAPAKLMGLAKVRNRVYRVKRVREIALFPVSTGVLDIGAQEGRYAMNHQPVVMTSEALKVTVTDPPSAGRPPGYARGDTGNFQLSASVNPRAIDQGDVIAVNVTLKGTGNVPRATLPLPMQKDVAFMAPETSEKTDLAEGDKFYATDTFRYVVRIDREGDVDLGAIDLPFFNPDKHQYGVAHASLGVVHVKKSDVQKPAQDEPNPVALPDARAPVATLSGPRAASGRHIADSPWYFGALFASPLAYAFLRGGAFATSRLRARKKARHDDPKRVVHEHLRDAKKAAADGQAKALAAIVKKYVEAQTIAFASVNVKSASAEDVASMLENAGVKKDAAKSAAEILSECSALAFRPDDPSIDEVSPLLARARALEDSW